MLLFWLTVQTRAAGRSPVLERLWHKPTTANKNRSLSWQPLHSGPHRRCFVLSRQLAHKRSKKENCHDLLYNFFKTVNCTGLTGDRKKKKRTKRQRKRPALMQMPNITLSFPVWLLPQKSYSSSFFCTFLKVCTTQKKSKAHQRVAASNTRLTLFRLLEYYPFLLCSDK